MPFPTPLPMPFPPSRPHAAATRALAERSRAARPVAGARRGSSLLLVLVLTACMVAIAGAALALQSSATLVTRYHDRERDFRFAAEAALALGRSRLERDASVVLPDSGFVTFLNAAPVLDARGVAIPGTRVTVYAGRSGVVTGQYGTYATLIAQADDGRSTRYVRRLEVAAENFARFAMFTNTWSAGCYGTGEFIRGLGWSNQGWTSCGSPTYYDTVGAVTTITGGSPTWIKGPGSIRPGQQPIPMPTVARLAALPTYAAGANLSVTAPANAVTRLEFEAVDLDDDGDSTGVDEGFLRVFVSHTGGNAPDATRLPTWSFTNVANTRGSGAEQRRRAWADSTCGDLHGGRFYPVAVHSQTWFRDAMPAADPHRSQGSRNRDFEDLSSAARDTVADLVLGSATARCFPAGSPQLAAVERVVGQARESDGSGGTWQVAETRVGGDESTFTPNGRWGRWQRFAGAVPARVAAVADRPRQAPYFFPLSKQLNPGFRGVAHVNGNAWVGGQLRSRLTLYVSGAVHFYDDLTYVTPPNTPGQDCNAAEANILGIIAVGRIMVDSSVLHRPQRALVLSTGNSTFRWLNAGGQPDFRLHGVLMSLTNTVGVNGWANGPSLASGNCLGQATSGGCLAQVGGVIEQSISATWVSNAATGFAENRQVDQCMLVTSPPYFPLTGRYFNNRYYEMDPARFDAAQVFRQLQSGI